MLHLALLGILKLADWQQPSMNDASLALYKSGSTALQQARYEEAIADLEQFCKETAHRQSKQFFQAQMWLIQAYHKNHQDLHAIALCEQLAKSEIPQVKQWADRALTKLLDDEIFVPNVISESTPSATAQTPIRANPDTVSPLPIASRSSAVERTTPKPTPHHASSSDISSQRVTQRHSRQAATSAKPKDYTTQIMTAFAHGSISILASILLFILFSDSVIANSLGIARLIVPLFIFLTTQDAIVKENAREAVNYVLTCLILLIPIGFAAVSLAVILVAAWPVAILLSLVVVGYLLVLSVYPVIATFLCLTQENYVFRYPNWLILHLL